MPPSLEAGDRECVLRLLGANTRAVCLPIISTGEQEMQEKSGIMISIRNTRYLYVILDICVILSRYL